jgi:hypothetical protein
MVMRFLTSVLAIVVVIAVFVLAPAAAAGQAAAAHIPRLADGKPDFNGIWDRPRVPDLTRHEEGCGSGAPTKGCKQTGAGELPYTAWGREQMTGPRFDYAGRCLPWGYTRAMGTAYPLEIIQTPKRLAYLFESNNVFHVIPTDGRNLPEQADPLWMGRSIGRYEGDTLVIETTGFNGQTWLDTAEHPSSDQLRVTERLRHIDADHLEYVVTFDDPKTYMKPFSNTRIWSRMKAGDELMEWWCMENNKDLLEGHLSPTHINTP